MLYSDHYLLLGMVELSTSFTNPRKISLSASVQKGRAISIPKYHPTTFLPGLVSRGKVRVLPFQPPAYHTCARMNLRLDLLAPVNRTEGL